MEFWKNKTAIVTGAGQGIGAQIAKDLMKIGMCVIGFEQTEDMVDKLIENSKNWDIVNGKLVTCKCDVSNDNDLKNAFEDFVAEYGGVDLLINNAALGTEGLISTGNVQKMIDVVDVNIYGLIACTSMAIKSMKKKQSGGLIININSISGHYMPAFAEPKINMYIASKKAMTAYNEVVQNEIQSKNLNIKVVSISPGIVKTNLFKNSGIKFINDEFFEKNPHLTVEDVSKVVLMVLSQPANIHVKEVIFHALHEIY